MDRRTFNQFAGFGALGVLLDGKAKATETQPIQPLSATQTSARTAEWPGQIYRRLLVDTHVPDWGTGLLHRGDGIG